MAAPAPSITTRLAYGLRQLPRFAWYMGHGIIMRELSKQARRDAGERRGANHRDRSVPGRWQLYGEMAALFRQDLANVEAGIYPLPDDHDGAWPLLLDRSRLFFRDLPAVHRRRESGNYREILNKTTRGKRPDYYLQNFHFQSGGWMTPGSAQRYDVQVEVLFRGTANAIRRQALVPLHEVFVGRDQRRLQLLDVGCGTGRFLDFVKQAWPRLPTLGVDMSEPYIAEAKRHLRRWCWLNLIVGNGESLPLHDESQDAVTSIFMLHELPGQVRRIMLREFARVLKPGGRVVLLDSLQTRDAPSYDAMLEKFPQNYHEPYYLSYLSEDFRMLGKACGLEHVRDSNAFISKVMVFDKPRANKKP